MTDLSPRTTDTNHKLGHAEFKSRFFEIFRDPSFSPLQSSLEEISEIAWKNFQESHKAPQKMKAGPGYANPDYELSMDWVNAKRAIEAAQKRHDDPTAPTRVLIINGSHRNEGTCPSEISKTSRLVKRAVEQFEKENIEVQLLELDRMTVEYGKTIHPCKACVSTAMPLCHWPCSCYPNHGLGQVHDWMNEIYPMWAAAHGIMIIIPTYWYSMPSALKLMLDRLVCSDGGNADPTSTKGKDAKLAKEIELNGWDFPGHLKDRHFSILVHGDTNGLDGVRNALRDSLEDMRLIHTGGLSRFIGYMQPYATAHADLDKDKELFEEVDGLASTLSQAVKEKRAGVKNNPAEGSDEVRRK